jgi:hypothetical protein
VKKGKRGKSDVMDEVLGTATDYGWQNVSASDARNGTHLNRYGAYDLWLVWTSTGRIRSAVLYDNMGEQIASTWQDTRGAKHTVLTWLQHFGECAT